MSIEFKRRPNVLLAHFDRLRSCAVKRLPVLVQILRAGVICAWRLPSHPHAPQPNFRQDTTSTSRGNTVHTEPQECELEWDEM